MKRRRCFFTQQKTSGRQTLGTRVLLSSSRLDESSDHHILPSPRVTTCSGTEMFKMIHCGFVFDSFFFLKMWLAQKQGLTNSRGASQMWAASLLHLNNVITYPSHTGFCISCTSIVSSSVHFIPLLIERQILIFKSYKSNIWSFRIQCIRFGHGVMLI